MAALEIRSLCKRYGTLRVLEDLSLRVERGQVYGLLGPNGSGKTTTLSCALGLLRPTSGEVRLLGEPARRIWRTRGRVAVVFDHPPLLPGLTVLQNLEYLARVRGHAGGRGLREALECVGIADLAARRAGKLSLGQTRRLAIAGALAGAPELLVLDEPLSGLDGLGVRSMLALIGELRSEGLTIVLSSHRLHEMEQVVTHVGILLAGRIAREGTLEDVLAAGRRLLRVRVSDAAAATAVLEGVAGTEIVARRPVGDEHELELFLDGFPPARLNRALVEASCEVSAMVPERSTLQAVFEQEVDALARASRAHAEARA